MPDVAPATAELSTQVVRLVRQMGVLKSEFAVRAKHGLEWSSYVVLFHLVSRGPMRVTSLAEVLCSDPSTVSRQTSALVEAGLVDRGPDPDDGRAVQLAATDRGIQVAAAVRDERDAVFADVLQNWTTGDVDALVGLLDRFCTDLELRRSRPLPGTQTPPPDPIQETA